MSDRSMDSEAELVSRASAGDRQAFAALVERHWGRLQRWLRGVTGSLELSEDLTQEAFFRAWRGLATFRAGADFRIWLFGIARNAWLDSRKGARGRTVECLSGDYPGREQDPQLAAQEREDCARFAAACAGLDELYREPFLLWSQEGLSFAEIGRICDIAEATARWRVFRARHLLVQLLLEHPDEEVNDL